MTNRYILNIDKSSFISTPQIVGRVSDLPFITLQFQIKNGDKPLNLAGYVIEFRGLTPSGDKVVSSKSITLIDSANGVIGFRVPDNLYSSAGLFERAYFAFKKYGKTDTTQDIIIHVLDSVDMDSEDAQDVFDTLDTIIAEAESKIKSETDRLLNDIRKDTESTISESNAKLESLNKSIDDFVSNTNVTLSKIDKGVSDMDSKYVELQKRVDDIATSIDESELVTQSEFKGLKLGFRNLIRNGDFSQGLDHYTYTDGLNIRVQNVATAYRYPVTPSGKELRIEIDPDSQAMFLNQDININFDKGTKVLGLHFHYYTSVNFEGYFRPYIRIVTTDGETKYLNSTMQATNTNSQLVIFNNVAEIEGYSVESARMVINLSDVKRGTIWIQGITVVDGLHIGDWTPALEDTLLIHEDLQSQINELKKMMTAMGGS